MNDDAPNTWATVQSSIVKELNDVDLKSFACEIDKGYEEAIMECVGYTKMCEELVSKSCINSYYDLFRKTFSTYHLVSATILSSRSFSVPAE